MGDPYLTKPALSSFQDNTHKLDFELFVSLFEEYYLSDDPSALGNFINGKLTYTEEEDDDAEGADDPGLVDRRVNSSTSIHSMDGDINGLDAAREAKKAEAAKVKAKEAAGGGGRGPLKIVCDNVRSATEECCVLS